MADWTASRRTAGDDPPLMRLLLGGVRDDDAADALFAFVSALGNDAVV